MRLSRADAVREAGVDTFVKQRKSLFVFLQGHPEYEAVTLLLEYRRDIGTLSPARARPYPPMPHGYFDEETAKALTALRAARLVDRRAELLAEFPTAGGRGQGQPTTGVRPREELYRNWLQYIWAQKQDHTMHEMAVEERLV